MLACSGCGGQTAPSAATVHLEREDLIAVARALEAERPAVALEVVAARSAWRLIANGLPGATGATARAPVATAARAAEGVVLPVLFEEHLAASVTGPGSSLVGLFRSYDRLSARGWRLMGANIDDIGAGPPASVRFARENVALYIESVYDAHFGLAQIGKQLLKGYEKLGGGDAFGSSLTPAQVSSLAGVYSEERDRLHPHVGVRLGS
ncbi:MAG TPA: hypothetical protein VII01_07780 [Solirubrobacteraceae bacterium]